MAARLTQDERDAVAQRIFAALSARYPKHYPKLYIALIEPKAAASSAEQILSTAAAVVRNVDNNIGGEADTRVKGSARSGENAKAPLALGQIS
jgi:hypothetical protein